MDKSVAETFDVDEVRRRFPSLALEVAGRPAVFLDGPGGTQTPASVSRAMVRYLEESNANVGGSFATSRATDAVVAEGRAAMADFLGAARPEEVVFGANMTTLTLAMSRALARRLEPGDEIVVTRLDHDANVAPWLLAARDSGATVRWLDFDPADCTLRLDQLDGLLGSRTRLVAVGAASNAVGTINDVAAVCEAARKVSALVYVDAVHFAPHAPIDVAGLGCDFLACSPYKFFGPHSGVLWARHDLLEEIEAYKVRPAPAHAPGKWETGTQSFEAIAGVAAAVDYIASLVDDDAGDTRRDRLLRAMGAVRDHEAELTRRFLAGASEVPGLRVWGMDEPGRALERTPTFAVSLEGFSPGELAERLGERGLFVWHGDYYAREVMERLGRAEQGGLVRIGYVHYHTVDEVERTLEELRNLSGSG